jgi:hypothetical protein
MNQLASNACFSAETYELVSAAVDSLNADVDAKRRGVQGEEPAQEGRAGEVPLQMPRQQATGVHNEEKSTKDGFKNPQRQPNKGRPKESEKRRKTLLEQREDAAKKNKKVKKDGETSTRAKKKKPAKQTRCPFCLENHHVSDCLVLKATLAQTSKVDACATEPTEPAVTAKANFNFDLNL